MNATEKDLADLKAFISDRFNELDKKIDALDKKIDVYTARTDERLKSIDDRIGNFDKRLEKVESHYATLITDIADLKGAKSLIIPIVVAVLTSLTTLLIRAIPNP